MLKTLKSSAFPQMAAQPAPGEWTYLDWLELPDDGRRYEIIEGVLYVTNAPNIDHQFAVSAILAQMYLFVTEHELGFVLTAPFEVHLSEKTRPVQPDVLFIKAENWPERGAKYFEGAPDLVVEVLSPGTARTDQVVKFNAYESAGISEYWLVNPKARLVQVYTLSAGEYALLGQFTGADIIQSAALPGVDIIADSLFDR